jgi:hypothetical protein
MWIEASQRKGNDYGGEEEKGDIYKSDGRECQMRDWFEEGVKQGERRTGGTGLFANEVESQAVTLEQRNGG